MPIAFADMAVANALEVTGRVSFHRIAAAWLANTGEDLDGPSLIATAQHVQTYCWAVGAIRSGLFPHSEREQRKVEIDLLRRSLRERMRLVGLLPADAPPLGALRLDRLDADIAALCGIPLPGAPLNAGAYRAPAPELVSSEPPEAQPAS